MAGFDDTAAYFEQLVDRNAAYYSFDCRDTEQLAPFAPLRGRHAGGTSTFYHQQGAGRPSGGN
jgi:hypothetical protein